MTTPPTSTISGRMAARRGPALGGVVICGALLVSVAMRAAAQAGRNEAVPPSMSSHAMLEDPFNHSVLVDQCEAQDADDCCR